MVLRGPSDGVISRSLALYRDLAEHSILEGALSLNSGVDGGSEFMRGEERLNQLEERGICLLPELAPEDLAVRAKAEVLKAISYLDPFLAARRSPPKGDWKIVYPPDPAFPNYRNFAEHPGPVVVFRGAADPNVVDSGMIDVFNADKAFGPATADLRNILASQSVIDQLSTVAGHPVECRTFNVYVNRGVSRTRCFHADTYGTPQFKVFCYLSDVTNLAAGPFCYVLDSHLDGPVREENQLLSKRYYTNSTEAILFNPNLVRVVIGRSGDGFVSDQRGFHRGMSQSPSAERVLAVASVF